MQHKEPGREVEVGTDDIDGINATSIDDESSLDSPCCGLVKLSAILMTIKAKELD